MHPFGPTGKELRASLHWLQGLRVITLIGLCSVRLKLLSVGSRGIVGKSSWAGQGITSSFPYPSPAGAGSTGLLWLHFSPRTISVLGMEPPPRPCDPASLASPPPAPESPLSAKLWGLPDPLRTSLGRPDPVGMMQCL